MRREVARAPRLRCLVSEAIVVSARRSWAPTLLGYADIFQGSLDGAWGDLTSACAEGPSVAIDHLRWEAPQRAISHGGLGYEPNRHQANRKECAMKLTSAQVE